MCRWEICKNTADATAEFDRTVQFIEQTIETYKEMESASGTWEVVSGIMAKVCTVAMGTCRG